jgi:DNA repair protein RecN (Recombination protein N)
MVSIAGWPHDSHSPRIIRAVLVELLVENYAVVEKLRVRFHNGLNVLTGETGSGKSLVVDALGLLFGGRASTDLLRAGTDRARVSGIFDAPAGAAPLLAGAGIEVEDGELLIEREILAGGKSRAFIANRPVTAALLRELAPLLGDIHGQHEQQRLFSGDAQMEFLDGFAGTSDLVAQIASTYREWCSCTAELDELARTEQEKLRLLDLWTFQRNEIEAARLKPGEDTGLDAERRVLQNVGKLMESATTAYASLYDDEESAYARTRLAVKRLEELSRIDDNVTSLVESLRPAQIAIEEAARGLQDYLGRLEADPDRLEQIEERLATIDRLKRKYGATVDEILRFLDDATRQIEMVESTSERRAAVQARQQELRNQFEQAACVLTRKRKASAGALAGKVTTELKALAMERAVFEVLVEPAPWSAAGADAVTFRFSANAGEEPRPLEKVASGGELSRIALALKTCVTAGVKGRTLVFDEVDAGIGGTAAESVGRRLKSLSDRQQVLCVTHLAQIASFADHHYAVSKHEVRGRTVAQVEELAGDSRTREVGRMIAGQRLTPEALKHAEQLIRLGSAG